MHLLVGPRAQGAAHIARFFKAQGMHFEFVLDEGGFIISGLIPRFSRPIATINTGEKGSVTMHLTVDAVGGHSSNPPAVQVRRGVCGLRRAVSTDIARGCMGGSVRRQFL